MQKQINRHIFREYDIRGIVAEDLGDGMPVAIGRALATELRRRRGDAKRLTIAVGRDNRPSSPELAAQVIEGIRSAGVDVIDVGTVPTPVLYFATVHYETDGGIQITGSHNPPEYNGFKMVVDGRALYGEAIQRLREMIETEDFATGEGAVEERDVLPEYFRDVTGRFTLERPVKVVVDCGNGTGSVAAVQ